MNTVKLLCKAHVFCKTPVTSPIRMCFIVWKIYQAFSFEPSTSSQIITQTFLINYECYLSLFILIYVLPRDFLPFILSVSPTFLLSLCRTDGFLTSALSMSLSFSPILLSLFSLQPRFLILFIFFAWQPHLSLSCLAIDQSAFIRPIRCFGQATQTSITHPYVIKQMQHKQIVFHSKNKCNTPLLS